jgi:hypothetical protein
MPGRQWNAKELIKLSGSFWEACTLHTAVELDVFSVLAEGPMTAGAAANALNVTEDGLSRLLNALTAMQLLDKKGDTYTVTQASRAYLCKDSGEYMGYLVSHHHHLSTPWSRMDEAITTGKPFRSSVEEIGGRQIESFLMGMHNTASFHAPLIAERMDLTGTRRLLDLGGGPGTYSIHFCKRFPGLEADVFDLPTSRSFAVANIDNHGLKERIGFIDGNFNSDEYPGPYDAVWMSHILHGEGEEACRGITGKAAKALEPGGKIFIHEFILDNDGASPLFPALFSINMFLHTEKGKSYTEAELNGMLAASGFKDIQRLPVRTPTQSGVIMGIKK